MLDPDQVTSSGIYWNGRQRQYEAWRVDRGGKIRKSWFRFGAYPDLVNTEKLMRWQRMVWRHYLN